MCGDYVENGNSIAPDKHGVILWGSGLGLLMGKFHQFFAGLGGSLGCAYDW